MLETNTKAIFPIEVKKVDGTTLNILFKVPTLREYTSVSQKLEATNTVGSDSQWIDQVIDALSALITSHTKDELLDTLNTSDLIQLREDWLTLVVLKEIEIKKSVWLLPTVTEKSKTETITL